jgi:hypothetical protein
MEQAAVGTATNSALAPARTAPKPALHDLLEFVGNPMKPNFDCAYTAAQAIRPIFMISLK